MKYNNLGIFRLCKKKGEKMVEFKFLQSKWKFKNRIGMVFLVSVHKEHTYNIVRTKIGAKKYSLILV